MDTWMYQVSCQTDSTTLRVMRELAHFAARAGGAVDEVADDVLLAVGEVLSNASLHAYPNTVGSLEIDYRLIGGRLYIDVQDHGGPLRGSIEVPNELPPLGMSHGLGLYAVGQLMDDVEVKPNDDGDGVAVRMSRDLT
ncbi:MAG TPA: ATP-binding protein [Anaerolineales bacterium]